MNNIEMGNIVLMPQFYGLGIKQSSRKKISQNTEDSQQSVEIRKMCYKSTYDDYSQNSLVSQEKNVKMMEVVDHNIPKLGDGYLNTQESLDNTKNQASEKFQTPVKTSNLQQVYKREDKSEDPFSEEKNGSIINSVLEIQDTELEKRNSREKCKILMDIGQQQFRQGQHSKSLYHLEEVLRESQTSFPQDISQKAKVYSMLGSNCLRMSIFDRSADYYLKSLSLMGTNPQKNKKNMSDVHLTLGTIYQRTNHIDEALQHYQQSYKLKTQFMPKMSPEFLMPLMNLGQLQGKKGNHMKAIQRYCQTLAINRSIYGNQHVQVARNFYLMAMSLFQIKQYSMWLEYHYQSIKMMKDLKLQGHKDYQLYLKTFPQKLRILIGQQNFTKDVVQRSIHMANLLLTQDEQIQFLQKIKGDLEDSMARQ